MTAPATAPEMSAVVEFATLPVLTRLTSPPGTPLRCRIKSRPRLVIPLRPVTATCLPRKSATEVISGRLYSHRSNWFS